MKGEGGGCGGFRAFGRAAGGGLFWLFERSEE